MYKKYVDLEPIRRLRYEGAELVGKHLYLTIKRDGENVPLYLNDDGGLIIASRNNPVASSDIQNRVRSTPEHDKAFKLLTDSEGDIILYGESMKHSSPTGIEPPTEDLHWIMFDIWSISQERYLPYDLVLALGEKYDIPVVQLLCELKPSSVSTLMDKIDELLEWCKENNYEGVVGKDYDGMIFFKEKTFIPGKYKKKRERGPKDPPLPEERILRALQHAYDEVGDQWDDVSVAMPAVARHAQLECDEHGYSMPSSLYQYYLNTPEPLEESHAINFFSCI